MVVIWVRSYLLNVTQSQCDSKSLEQVVEQLMRDTEGLPGQKRTRQSPTLQGLELCLGQQSSLFGVSSWKG